MQETGGKQRGSLSGNMKASTAIADGSGLEDTKLEHIVVLGRTEVYLVWAILSDPPQLWLDASVITSI